MKDRTYNYIACSLILLIVCAITFKDLTKSPIGYKIKNNINFSLNTQEFSPDNLKRLIDSLDIKEPEIVYAQAFLETGVFTSNIFKTKNNLFGFSRRDECMYFWDWTKSVKYYKRWQLRKYNGGDYYLFLKNVGYAEDTLYLKKIKWIVNNERNKNTK